MILCKEEYAKKIDSAVFPGQQGGPLEHVIAAKAVALQDRRQRAVRRAPAAHDRRARRRSPTELLKAGHGVNVLTGGTDVHLVLVDLRDCRARADRQAGRGPPARDRHHGQPQRRAVRPAPADGGLGPAHRHARARHARPAGGGLHRGRQILAAALTPEYEARAGELAERVQAVVERYPLYDGLAAPAVA